MRFSVWVQSYIDFEIAEGERERTRALYERLLDRTRHVKVWMSYAAFEAAPLPLPEDDDEDAAAARQRAAQSSAESPASRDVHARACGPYIPCVILPALQQCVSLYSSCWHAAELQSQRCFDPVKRKHRRSGCASELFGMLCTVKLMEGGLSMSSMYSSCWQAAVLCSKAHTSALCGGEHNEYWRSASKH